MRGWVPLAPLFPYSKCLFPLAASEIFSILRYSIWCVEVMGGLYLFCLGSLILGLWFGGFNHIWGNFSQHLTYIFFCLILLSFPSVIQLHAHCCCCSVTKSCPTLCDPMNGSTPGFPVHHHLPELAQTHVHWVSDVIQPSPPLSPPSPPAFHLSQHQGLFQWVGSSHQVAKVLKLQLQHQSLQ